MEPLNWKRPIEREVSSYLVPGHNSIAITVTNSGGPPALWLNLSTREVTIDSDTDWTVSLNGATALPARLATRSTDPTRINPDSSLPDVRQALASRYGTILVFTFLVAAVILVGRALIGPLKTRLSGAHIFLGAAFIVGLLWLALMVNNMTLLSPANGFDAGGHLDYIQFLLDHRTLPEPSDGWSMFHPPLFYSISAVSLGVLGLQAHEAGAAMALRIQSLFFGLVQLSMVFASLRLLFPKQLNKQLVGLLLGGFLPLHLYMYQYVTNETLVTTLASVAIYQTLRILRSEAASIKASVWLGFSLGACMLTKYTGVIIAFVVLLSLVGWLVAGRRRVYEWFATIGVTGLVSVLICGWRYAGMWSRHGTPFVGNWDQGIGAAWWQDPGYQTAAYFLRFGRSLTFPFFSGYHRFGDGIYSTLWGDGLIGGGTVLEPWSGSPWNYDLMAIGYVLALVPTLAVLLGGLMILIRMIKQPATDWLLLIAVLAAASAMVALMTFKVPSYAQAKAIYGMVAAVPFCILGAYGADQLMRHTRVGHWLVTLVLGVWAINAYATFWIPAGSAEAHARLGRREVATTGGGALAEQHLLAAMASDPRNATANLGQAMLLNSQGKTADATRQLQDFLVVRPDHTGAHRRLAGLLAAQESWEAAFSHAQTVIQLAPDNRAAWLMVGTLEGQRGRHAQASDAFRQALRIDPVDAATHYELGKSLSATGDQLEGLNSFQRAARLAPTWPDPLTATAWIMATGTPDLRDIPQAIVFAERAAVLTDHQDPLVLDTLAVVYASASRLDEARATVTAALALASAAQNSALVNRLMGRLATFQDPQSDSVSRQAIDSQ